MPRLPSPTAFRLAGFYSLAFAIVTLALGAGVYVAVRGELRYDLDQRVVTERQAVLSEARTGGRDALAPLIAARSAHGGSDMRYALIDARGRLLAGRPIEAMPPLGWSEMNFLKPDGELDATRAFARPMDDGRILIVGADPEAIESLDEHLLPLFAAGFGLVAIVGVTGAFILSAALGRRLETINRTADAIIGGDLDRRVAVTGAGDEFDRLAITLNQMLDRIGGLMENLRQVSGDIAHDLRTPLSRLRQRLELAAVGSVEPQALHGAIEDAIDRIDDMLQLFASMLAIAEVEAGGDGVRMAPLDLSRLVLEVAESFVPAIEDNDRAFRIDVDQGIGIEGNRALLAQMLVNLLDNAMRHTPAGTGVEVQLKPGTTQTELSVSDHGPGIAPEDCDRVFDRFARLERSRTTPGHGLGLSLVSAIAKAHGGSAAIHDNHPGVRMMVSLPRNSQ